MPWWIKHFTKVRLRRCTAHGWTFYDRGICRHCEREFSDWCISLSEKQEPLGREFSEVLHKNAWDLYAR